MPRSQATGSQRRVECASRRERLDERRGCDVRNICRLAQAPGSEADHPRHMPSIEDLERCAIGAECADLNT
jgi:hypothetical protein